MMETVNISMPKQMAKKMDEIVEYEGYASRSELIRTLIRMYTYLKESPSSRKPLFETHEKVDIKEVSKLLKDSDLYSDTFVKSVTKGLKKSSVYEDKTTKKRSKTDNKTDI